jgi:hypothetical protein
MSVNIDWQLVGSSVASALSLAFAAYKYLQQKRMIDFSRQHNWFMFQRTLNTNGHVQLALKQYKELASDATNTQVIETLAKADAFGQELVKEIIRQIQMTEPSFKTENISQWQSEGKLTLEKAVLFKQFMVVKHTELVKKSSQDS